MSIITRALSKPPEAGSRSKEAGSFPVGSFPRPRSRMAKADTKVQRGTSSETIVAAARVLPSMVTIARAPASLPIALDLSKMAQKQPRSRLVGDIKHRCILRVNAANTIRTNAIPKPSLAEFNAVRRPSSTFVRLIDLCYRCYGWSVLMLVLRYGPRSPDG